jgi:ubiquinone/menaquinone biosynthesis C-methylase UbiE
MRRPLLRLRWPVLLPVVVVAVVPVLPRMILPHHSSSSSGRSTLLAEAFVLPTSLASPPSARKYFFHDDKGKNKRTTVSTETATTTTRNTWVVGVDTALHLTPPTTTTTTTTAKTTAATSEKDGTTNPKKAPAVGSRTETAAMSSSSAAFAVAIGRWLLDAALRSPLWKRVLVPAARQKIIATAQANGIPWTRSKRWLWERLDTTSNAVPTAGTTLPDWYVKAPYHAYDTGHLSWEAAAELELASAAIGARNVPRSGRHGEAVFRDRFRAALAQAGARYESAAPPLPDSRSGSGSSGKSSALVILDVGCGTGTSTRLLAKQFPHESTTLLGLDLSPYFIATGRRLQELAPTVPATTTGDESNWICTVAPDPRIEYRWGNAAATGLADASVHVVNMQFVAHELPLAVTRDVFREAHRILADQGQLWFCEMDFQAPAYQAQRSNPLLFALLRATEPYLDDYADGQASLWEALAELGFDVTIAPATGRHFAAVAVKRKTNARTTATGNKGTIQDLRFDAEGNYRVEDTHLQVWENQQAQA